MQTQQVSENGCLKLRSELHQSRVPCWAKDDTKRRESVSQLLSRDWATRHTTGEEPVTSMERRVAPATPKLKYEVVKNRRQLERFDTEVHENRSRCFSHVSTAKARDPTEVLPEEKDEQPSNP